MPTVSRLRCRRARNGSSSELWGPMAGVFFSMVVVPMNAIAINAATPKNGPRQLMLPSRPPTSGPVAMPMPSAAS